MAESAYRGGCFITLTYNDDHLPTFLAEDGNVAATLRPADLHRWIKAMRKRLNPFRFFAVGEYGDKSGRPHYHAVVFDADVFHVEHCARLLWERIFEFGFVSVGLLEVNRASYVAQYTLKKMTKPDDARLGGRWPEFARQSRRPPLGAEAMQCIRDSLFSLQGCQALLVKGDVPTEFRYQGKRYPIGRYWREWLRRELNVPVPKQVCTGEPKSPDYFIELEKAKATAAKTERAHTRKRQNATAL